MRTKNIGVVLRKVRLAAGYTQTETALVLGMEQAAISRVENGTQMLSLIQLEKFSIEFKVPIDKIINASVDYSDVARRFSNRRGGNSS